MPNVGGAPTAGAVRAAALQIDLPRLDSPPERLGMQSAAARAAAVSVLALGLKWARAMAPIVAHCIADLAL